MKITSLVKKAHSLYIGVAPIILRELRWKRYDKLILVTVDGDLVCRKMRAEEMADAVVGSMVRRKKALEKTTVPGAWDNTRGEKIGH